MTRQYQLFTLTIGLFVEPCEATSASCSRSETLGPQRALQQTTANLEASKQGVFVCMCVCDFLHNRRKQSSFITSKPQQVGLSSSLRLLRCCILLRRCGINGWDSAADASEHAPSGHPLHRA